MEPRNHEVDVLNEPVHNPFGSGQCSGKLLSQSFRCFRRSWGGGLHRDSRLILHRNTSGHPSKLIPVSGTSKQVSKRVSNGVSDG